LKKKRTVTAPRQAKKKRKNKRSKVPAPHKGFAAYQQQASQTIYGKFRERSGQLASMFGLASETGSILDSYKRYLRDKIDLPRNRDFLRVELGDLLWYVAVVATACELSLSEIAAANLAKVRVLYKVKFADKTGNTGCVVLSEATELTDIAADFTDYQFEASKSSRLSLRGPTNLVGPLCGLVGSMGKILQLPKGKPESFDLKAHRKVLRTELGDLLWYLSAVATASNLNLGDVAEANLARARDLYRKLDVSLEERFRDLPTFDDPAVPTECFPRRMIVKFEEASRDRHNVSVQTIIHAEPNAFPEGPIKVGGKWQGFRIDTPLGDLVDDNSSRADGYRYHDAVHMGFMTVLGWSPTMRDLLKLKRNSKPDTRRIEDGQRAIFTDEGLTAILARLEPRRMGFLGENAVDGEIIDTVQALVRDTEVNSLPGWLWRKAISQGFAAMHELEKNGGGFLLADLDMRTLTYSKVQPDVPTKKRD
jgi:NTP pyrophosphatase (non-canonical NTP hydrolase)